MNLLRVSWRGPPVTGVWLRAHPETARSRARAFNTENKNLNKDRPFEYQESVSFEAPEVQIPVFKISVFSDENALKVILFSCLFCMACIRANRRYEDFSSGLYSLSAENFLVRLYNTRCM